MSIPEPKAFQIAVIDDDLELLRVVTRWLESGGYQVVVHADAEAALQNLDREEPSLILLDLHMTAMSGMEVLDRIRHILPSVPVVMLTAEGSHEAIVEATQRGAWDYLQKPVDRRRLLATVQDAMERALVVSSAPSQPREGFAALVGRSPAMHALFHEMHRVSPSEVTVLVQGESGVGKELVANAIHAHSPRRDEVFVAINCAAIPEALQEAELFGYEKGAFTGATTAYAGRFEQANRGTLFLDEVGELSLALQAKLLRVLQERTLYRLGGRSEVAVDVRIIAATHKDLAAEALAGRFRHDLFYRLSVFELVVPPLRDRRGDVLPLAEHFLARAGQARGVNGLHLGEGARGLIAAYDWPGNVRELRNAMERAAVLAQDTRITPRDLPPRILQCLESRAPAAPGPDSQTATAFPPTTSSSGALEAPSSSTEPPETSAWRPIEQVERDMILHALAAESGNVSAVIRRLQIPRTSLYRKMRAYGIEP